MKQNGIVYMYTNRVNDKKYIGKTWYESDRKKAHHRASGGCRAFHAAINKYGIESFDYQLLHSGIADAKVLAELEKIEIISRETMIPNGYNLVEGGFGGHISEETRELIRQRAIVRYQNQEKREEVRRNIIRMHADPVARARWLQAIATRSSRPEYREKISKAKKEKVDDAFKKKMSQIAFKEHSDPAYKEKHMAGIQKLKENPVWQEKHRKATSAALSKPVVCIETGEMYRNIRSIPDEISGHHVSEVCRGYRKTSGGLHWRFATKKEIGVLTMAN